LKRVAVVGSGIAGLATAHALAPEAQVTLFEAGPRFGGHSHTVDVTLEGITHGVDTGFLVFNDRTYPQLIRLFAELGVETAASDMSFSVQARHDRLEWSGSSLATVFAQKRNLLRPRFLAMLADVLRFNRITTDIARREADAELQEPIGDFLDRLGFGASFRDWYFLPMIGCIWSCPTDQMLRFPIGTMIRFCHNHGLIQVSNRPQWRTVRGGSRRYVERLLQRLPDARLNTPVLGLHRLGPQGAESVALRTAQGTEHFDEVVLASHSDQSLALLDDASADETRLLGAIRYHPNEAVLHTDVRVLPQRRQAWAAWNYARAEHVAREQSAVCLHYLINKLQPLPWQQPVLVSLNPDPAHAPDPARVIGRYDYSHPVFDQAAVAAQRELSLIQGRSHVWFCGAWTRYGFHEDGLMSAQAVVAGLRTQWAQQAEAATA